MFGSIWTSQVWKKDLQFSLRLSLRKRQISYKRLTLLQALEIKTTVKKRKKREKYTLNYFFFTTIFSFGGPLVGWESATFEDPKSLRLRSPLASNGRVARTTSIEEGTFFSLGWSLGPAGGLVASGATTLLASASFSATPCYWATSEGLSEKARALVGLALPTSAISVKASVLKLVEPDAWMAGG